MIENPAIQAMLNRKSIRRYMKEMPSNEVIQTIVRAGQQAPFAYQLCSLLLSRGGKSHPFNAPLLFTVCVDSHRLETVMAHRGWTMVSNDLSLLLLGVQDAALMAQNMVMAAESLGLGSCFLGAAPYRAKSIVEEYDLPPRVLPIVQLAMGYPAEDPPTRPRYPMAFTLFEDEYPEFDEELIEESVREMDEGFLAQDYYRRANYMVPLEGDREERFTFDNYSWTEHISRKAGLWYESPEAILSSMAECGFHIPGMDEETGEED